MDQAHASEVVWDQVNDVFSVVRGWGGVNFVYFIGEENNGPVKIGVSKNPISRLRGMKTGNPRGLRVEHVLVGDRDVERIFHRYWRPFAIYLPKKGETGARHPGTEWFMAEARERLFPVVEAAAAAQVDFLSQPVSEDAENRGCDYVELERIVLKEHADRGLVFPSSPRLLAA